MHSEKVIIAKGQKEDSRAIQKKKKTLFNEANDGGTISIGLERQWIRLMEIMHQSGDV